MSSTNENYILSYLEHCKIHKNLDAKMITAYRIDIKQFPVFCFNINLCETTASTLKKYISHMHDKFKPNTMKRKIASLKALYAYLEYKEIIYVNPWNKIKIQSKEPSILPKTISIDMIVLFLQTIYEKKNLNPLSTKKCPSRRCTL